MNKYYAQKLSGKKLKQCYDVAPLRIKQYLNAEIDFVCNRIKGSDLILELGCGYGRVFPKLLTNAKTILGIDNSLSSLEYGKQMFSLNNKVQFFQMDAGELGFFNDTFDAVLCIQNGLSAFRVEMKKLISEAIRVTKPGGQVFFSTYSEKFWNHRLEWFQLQSEQGLIGEIDYEHTKNGIIVCKDGFKAVTILPEDFRKLGSELSYKSGIKEIDNSSVVLTIEA
jgi:2-polyprenyl-6-hydroxyphenyl methylase/3-demethylubiquinone-9 3-methyltransferase